MVGCGVLIILVKNNPMAAPKDTNPQGSLEALQRELEANPFNTGVLSKLAETYANKGDYANACQLYEKLVRLDEDNGRAWTALGHCYLLKAEYQKCFTAYQKALYTLPHTRDPQLWYGIALLYNKFDTYEYAEPAYQAVLRIDPNFEQKNEVFFKLGQIYKKTGALDNAISYLRNSMIGDSVPLNRKIDALCSIGTCYEKQDKLPNALETYCEALSLERDNFKTMEYLGWAQAQNGALDEAIETLSKALELAGSNSAEEGDLHYLLGRCFLLQKKFSEGQTEFQKAIFKNPNSYLYWCSIGVLYAKASQPQDAFECFIKASNITQEESESWFNMGILYENCSQQLEAVLAYQRATSIDPKNTDAAKRKDELQDRNHPPPPEYVHPKFEVSDLPFSLQKSEKAKKASQLATIDQNKPGELVATAATVAPLPEAVPLPAQQTSQPAPQPTPQPRTVPPAPTRAHTSAPAVQTPPQRTPDPLPAKIEPAPSIHFTSDPLPSTPATETVPQNLPVTPPLHMSLPMQPQPIAKTPTPSMNPSPVGAQFPMNPSTPLTMNPGLPQNLNPQMPSGTTGGQLPSGISPAMAASMNPAFFSQMQSVMSAAMTNAMGTGQTGPSPGMGASMMPNSGMNPGMNSPNSHTQNGGMNMGMPGAGMNPAMAALAGMNPNMTPGMSSNGGMNPAMMGAGMGPGMPGANPGMMGMSMNPMGGQMMPGGQGSGQPGAGMNPFMNGMGSQPGFNPMNSGGGFPGMMNPMMNPFAAAMNPMMMSQMMQMMYMQQMSMMRSMLGMQRGGAPPKPEAAEPPAPSEPTEARNGQKRKGDSLPDTRNKRR